MINSNSKLYIAGHTGMVGSAITRKFQSEGFIVTLKILDLELNISLTVMKGYKSVLTLLWGM